MTLLELLNYFITIFNPYKKIKKLFYSTKMRLIYNKLKYMLLIEFKYLIFSNIYYEY